MHFIAGPERVLLLGTFHLCMNIGERLADPPSFSTHGFTSPGLSPVLSRAGSCRIQGTIKPRPLKIYRPESRDTSTVRGERARRSARMSGVRVAPHPLQNYSLPLIGFLPFYPARLSALCAFSSPTHALSLFFENAGSNRASNCERVASSRLLSCTE